MEEGLFFTLQFCFILIAWTHAEACEEQNDSRSGKGVSGMNKPICSKYRLLRLCILPMLMLSLTGCGARREARLRWVTYSETGAPLDANEVIVSALPGKDIWDTRIRQTGGFT